VTLPNADANISARNEAAALGAAVLSEVCAAMVFTQLAAEDFTLQAYGDAFREMQSLWQRDGRIDAATVGRLQCAALVIQCAEFAPSINESACEIYIKHISDEAKVRRAQGIALGIATDGTDPDEILQRVAQLANALGGERDAGWVDAEQGFAAFKARQQGKRPEYIRCGILPTFDRHSYLQTGDMLLIGGRPSAGKTLAILNLALGWARRGQRVVFFSLETSPDKIWDRLITCEYGLDFSAVKRGEVNTADLDLFEDGPAPFGRLPIYVCNAAGRSVAWMRAQAARLQADIAIIDYVQLIRSKGKDRYEQVTQTSIDLHEWAQADKVMVVGLCQLSRQGTDQPKLSDLRESGQLEQDADLVILLNKKTDPVTGAVEYTFDVAKNKEGVTGNIPMMFDGAHQRIREMTRAEDPPPPPAGPPEPVQQRMEG